MEFEFVVVLYDVVVVGRQMNVDWFQCCFHQIHFLYGHLCAMTEEMNREEEEEVPKGEMQFHSLNPFLIFYTGNGQIIVKLLSFCMTNWLSNIIIKVSLGIFND